MSRAFLATGDFPSGPALAPMPCFLFCRNVDGLAAILADKNVAPLSAGAARKLALSRKRSAGSDPTANCASTARPGFAMAIDGE